MTGRQSGDRDNRKRGMKGRKRNKGEEGLSGRRIETVLMSKKGRDGEREREGEGERDRDRNRDRDTETERQKQ